MLVLKEAVKKAGTRACGELSLSRRACEQEALCDSPAWRRVELTRLYRDVADPKPGDVGLSLAEGKTLLQTVQQEFAMAQIQQFCELRRTCRACGAARRADVMTAIAPS